MSDVLDLREKLQDTAGAIARLRREVAASPADPALAWDIESLEKRQAKLEAELLAASEAMGLDVCSYRVVPEQRRIKLAGLAGVLGGYQSLVSVFYDALKTGPKAKATVRAEVAEQTAFDFGYAFAGSAGFVFTVPNDRRLFDDSTLDESIRLIDQIAKTERPEDILTHARRIGPGPFRVMYRWAEDHVKAALSADIRWQRGSEIRRQTLIQVPEFRRLQQTISATSEEASEDVAVSGELVGADAASKTFHFRPDSGTDIRGATGSVIEQMVSVELPKRYAATIRRVTRVLFSTEEEKTTFELLRLDPL
jgi:hypothetical protein